MWGWKTVERKINHSVSVDEARDIAVQNGFVEHIKNPSHVVLKRSGTQLTTSGDKLPLELAIAEADEGLFLQLRYDTFVLGDSGDLDKLADDLAAKLRRAQS